MGGTKGDPKGLPVRTPGRLEQTRDIYTLGRMAVGFMWCMSLGQEHRGCFICILRGNRSQKELYEVI